MRELRLILSDLLVATTVSQIDSVVRELVEDHRASWRPVGDRETNFGTIHINTDPANALIERITNAIDVHCNPGPGQIGARCSTL
jgi:hypothetical protein